MKITYENLKYYEFIEELKRQKALVEKREDLKFKNHLIAEIEEENKHCVKLMTSLDTYDQDCIISDFQGFVAVKMIDYYNELSEKFQKAYAIFENQIAKLGVTKPFNFSHYPKIEAMNNAVNVMKHGNGRSYNALITTNSKYLQTPTEILSIAPGMPTSYMLSIIEYKFSGTLLNVEYSDLIGFFDEAISAWQSLIKANTEETTTDVGDTTSL